MLTEVTVMSGLPQTNVSFDTRIAGAPGTAGTMFVSVMLIVSPGLT